MVTTTFTAWHYSTLRSQCGGTRYLIVEPIMGMMWEWRLIDQCSNVVHLSLHRKQLFAAILTFVRSRSSPEVDLTLMELSYRELSVEFTASTVLFWLNCWFWFCLLIETPRVNYGRRAYFQVLSIDFNVLTMFLLCTVVLWHVAV